MYDAKCENAIQLHLLLILLEYYLFNNFCKTGFVQFSLVNEVKGQRVYAMGITPFEMLT